MGGDEWICWLEEGWLVEYVCWVVVLVDLFVFDG